MRGLYFYRFQFYPGLSGVARIHSLKKHGREYRQMIEMLEGMSCGAKIYIERLHPKKKADRAILKQFAN